MKNHFLLTVLLLMLCSMTMYAQKKITGQVLEPNGRRLLALLSLKKELQMEQLRILTENLNLRELRRNQLFRFLILDIKHKLLL